MVLVPVMSAPCEMVTFPETVKCFHPSVALPVVQRTPDPACVCVKFTTLIAAFISVREVPALLPRMMLSLTPGTLAPFAPPLLVDQQFVLVATLELAPEGTQPAAAPTR